MAASPLHCHIATGHDNEQSFITDRCHVLPSPPHSLLTPFPVPPLFFPRLPRLAACLVPARRAVSRADHFISSVVSLPLPPSKRASYSLPTSSSSSISSSSGNHTTTTDRLLCCARLLAALIECRFTETDITTSHIMTSTLAHQISTKNDGQITCNYCAHSMGS